MIDELFPNRKQAEFMVREPKRAAGRLTGNPSPSDVEVRLVRLMGQTILDAPEGSRLALGFNRAGAARLYALPPDVASIDDLEAREREAGSSAPSWPARVARRGMRPLEGPLPTSAPRPDAMVANGAARGARRIR
jgi:hypothetical protein